MPDRVDGIDARPSRRLSACLDSTIDGDGN